MWGSTRARLAAIEAELVAAKEHREREEKVMYGNGRQGLIEEVATMKQTLRVHTWLLVASASGIGTFAVNIVYAWVISRK